jgi:hypothetical protein
MPLFTIPSTVPYPFSNVGFGNFGDCPPRTTPRSAPFYLDWVDVTAQSPAFQIDFSNQSNMPEHISSLYVDNGRSHQGIFIIFPDTSFRLVVPPFKRGVYPVVTNSRRFIAGIFDITPAADDHTVIHVLNWSPPPYEGEALILPVAMNNEFDPSASTGVVPLAIGVTTWLRQREFTLQLSGLVAGAAGFRGDFALFADGINVANAGLHLFNGELVDANILFQTSAPLAAISWSYSWTVSAGACTSDGVTSGIINGYYDAAETN